ncbi:beta-N-acetylhexosaminidase [Draconibacterium sp.]|nr:beta-N-acetylhexosaminidase [Draconibacterium sp.]
MRYLGWFLIVIVLACSAPEKPLEINVIPLPNSIERDTGVLKLKRNISVQTNSAAAKKIIEQVNKEINGKFTFQINNKKNSDIKLILNANSKETERYKLQISKKKIQIEAGSEKGIYYGLQSIKQMLFFSEIEKDNFQLPIVTIEDEPRFGWRGLMLDESRHFFGVEKIKQILDLMALHKLNIFHWHLTDAPGWRIEIKKYPKLTSIGAIGNDMDSNAPARFYTQDEIREIVQYASNRFIEIIPEIDMPGHASAANRAYPEYSGGGSKSHPDFTFNPGNDEVYTYLTNILREIAELFPAKYIHLGGDEVHFGNQAWNTDKHVQKLMKREKLENLKEVEAYFVHRMADSIKVLNKNVIGWDEVVDHNLPNDNSLVMWWRHNMPNKLEAALSENYHVILCPRIPLYFDFVQQESHEWGRKWAGAFSTLELTYAFPPDTLPGFRQNLKNVVGLQANIWTERIQNNKRLDFMTNPRLSAMAEAAWTTNANKNLTDFKRRLKPMLSYLEKQDIYYYNPFNPQLTPEPPGVDKKQ